MNHSYLIRSEQDLIPLAQKLLSLSLDSRIFSFKGNLGAGKTTFIKVLCDQLNVIDKVSSPTFSIINEYRTRDQKPIYHFDFYRIKNYSEALDLGCEEYINNQCYCFIEWPEKSFGIIPVNCIQISILKKNSERIFNFALQNL